MTKMLTSEQQPPNYIVLLAVGYFFFVLSRSVAPHFSGVPIVLFVESGEAIPCERAHRLPAGGWHSDIELNEAAQVGVDSVWVKKRFRLL